MVGGVGPSARAVTRAEVEPDHPAQAPPKLVPREWGCLVLLPAAPHGGKRVERSRWWLARCWCHSTVLPRFRPMDFTFLVPSPL